MRTHLLVLTLIGIPNCSIPAQPVIPDGSTRLVQHAMGETFVPEDPQRVVVLDTSALDAVVALGSTPVGTLIYGTLPAYLGESITEIDIVGDINQPNLEAIIRLDPDLILGTRVNVAALYRQLDQIAPTIL
ncbi:MAG: ABC transporter substrate-binding protein, partial [Synechococcaceae cyanobacterium SM2_3_2]|nr:ABC transporter substrate-binding protein [Synechococcaceae cyanobacterium SM2_3_2]